MTASPVARNMESISAASLVDAMLRLRPDAAPTLRRLVDNVCSGRLMGPHAFSDAVQEELGGTILLDALLLLKGAPMTTVASDGDMTLRGKLFRHCIQCSGPCSIPGCIEMRSLIQTATAHTQVCTQRASCRTCIRWGTVLGIANQSTGSAQSSRKAVVACRIAGETPAEDPDQGETSSNDRKRAAASALPAHLMMLARSALGELSAPTSPGGSPRNSPAPSPDPLRPKRQKSIDIGPSPLSDGLPPSAQKAAEASKDESDSQLASCSTSQIGAY